MYTVAARLNLLFFCVVEVAGIEVLGRIGFVRLKDGDVAMRCRWRGVQLRQCVSY